jgi:hypothetical protein
VTDRIDVVAIIVSLALLLLVLELVRRRKLSEEYSLIWIVCAFALLVLALARRRLDWVALALDIHYPPALLILVVTFIVFVVSLYFTVAISRQRDQIEKLIEEVTILSARVREAAAGRPPHDTAPLPGPAKPAARAADVPPHAIESRARRP